MTRAIQAEMGIGALGVPASAGAASFVDQLADMVSLHAPDGTYRYASAAARELLGYEPAELVGSWAYDHFHPDDVAGVSVAHRHALVHAPFTAVYRLRHKAGHYVRVETTTRVIAEPGGEVKEIVCCTRRIGEGAPRDPALDREREAGLERVGRVLADESIRAVFQPMVELTTGRVFAYEALARFPEDPAHTPDRWFADAWRVGLGVPLELLAARKAAEALHRLPADVGLCINASPPTIAADGFLRSLGGQVGRVAVETTEHLQVEDYDDIDRKLAALREAGGRLMIDDFGAGFASLRHVLKLRPDWIKLDISLTEQLVEDGVARALVAAIASFAEQAEIGVIAEGIETREELDALRELGVRYGQGYYIAHPAALGDMSALA